MCDKVTYGIACGPTAPGVLVSVCRPQHISKRQATIKAWEQGYANQKLRVLIPITESNCLAISLTYMTLTLIHTLHIKSAGPIASSYPAITLLCLLHFFLLVEGKVEEL